MTMTPRENYLLEAMTVDERRRLAGHLETVALEPRQVLAFRDAPIEYVYFPVDAVTSTLVELEDGTTIEVGLMGAEGMTGLSLLFDREKSNTTVVVQIPGTARRIAAEPFVAEVVRPGGPFYRELLRYADMFMQLVALIGACNAVHGVKERCARWILLVQDRTGRPSFPLTHEFLSLMLGVRRASVTAAAAELRTSGAIDYTRGSLTVLDRERLRAASCPCYETITATIGTLYTAVDRPA